MSTHEFSTSEGASASRHKRDSTEPPSVQRRQYLQAVGATALGASLAGCSDTLGDSTGTLATSVSDQPHDIGDFERLVVTVFEIRVFPRGDGDDDDGNETADDNETAENIEFYGHHENDGNETAGDDRSDDEDDSGDGGSGQPIVIEVDDVEADLVQLQGDESQLVDESELETGEYSHLQVRVRDEVDAELEDGEQADVMTPGNAPLTFNQEFEIRADQTTGFIADFAPVRRGDGSYILRPVPSEIRVIYGDTEDDSDDDETDD